MKKTNNIFIGVVALLLAFSLNAWALPYPVEQGSSIIMYAGDHSSIEYEGNYQAKNIVTGVTFGTFCVEMNEHFYSGRKYKVKNIVDYAENGGLSGQTPGTHQDPLSNATKWLYYHFLNKDILAVTGKAENDYSLQLAIWMIEGELLPGLAEYNQYANDSIAKIYYDKAINSGDAGASYNVMVMNLVNPDGSAAQSQLVGAAPVPEPGTMMLFGIGMLGLAVYGKRRMNKDAR
ncbi:MAG: PEP-CTERM sorting domain-containing protein [Geobacteraceae bacterium]|nr:PEP-CTERM sorting domain-containing protein [Geobacteraceae bacterium]